ncbi:Retrovirus-related Pol polyprotein from transposon 297,Steroid 5-alpha-reductase DET2,Retrovirus-related Pol polyprotein from transposon 17.6,3-oxo-5-alpha-steroid 4-dehydrogenase 1,3-oxo-5-alpha-steroid 4-dehydrogenase 2 [Mytilus coruscus]|uniref:3-oxo-5alpha-steroid 4-dehydrogenase (NADP(+)) n=1 Tax=Mytilus coruscus TaxID=42192 RepID=A0A6J8BAK4_MYTCO|nr:Retrovirus-related Pol polyprotein from transposon 297,Steroid 5-alpha-reductase DET2,Retrovirus-related Pol polyprotein from transposon 17.6,3-oxo-5-alpha-steroid 4-dehydrogenase 1,3-oxo-5-alpha-steroid 4-dehydrogenase 2 [Mytilus coruscus]
MKSGILYRVYVTPSEEEIYQVVLPEKYRAIVLELAHDIPLSGHLGIMKTRDRILHHYFWPDVPFRRIAIDFVGPLPVTERKNKYILVIVDCATRYPEAVALRSQDAETVVDSLMEVFSRTNGMCEKFNGVLKRMLKAYASLEPKTWDKYLVYVLFAYREVPNDTTGFSPFELLYGRNVRGPLSVLKEQWEEPEDCQSSVLSYLIETRERLKMLSELAHQNEMNAKQVQKRYYDKKARSREIEVGTKVLVLLPTSESKLLAQWKGPYVVTDKVGPVDYKVKVRGKEKVYHVNMLKTWYERPEALKNEVEFLAYIDVAEDKFEDEYIDVDYKVTPQLVGKETVNDVRISEDLTDEQHRLISELIWEFSDIFTDVPKRTDLVHHKVKLITDKPVYRKLYPVPYALREKVQQEIDDMLKLGIIEVSDSPYAAPVVLVKKKDSSIRFCCDYREINKITEFDPAPMPQIDSVLNKIVGGGEIQPTQDKIQAIVDFKPPMTKKQVRSFIGLIGFYRKFISNFSKYSASITDLTKKGLPNKVKWTSEHQQCFDKLKSMIASEPVLSSPDFSLTFILCTDACNTGVGCVLEQEFKDGRHPILYMSKKFSDAERRYSVIEKECYAIVWAVKSLWVYLEGKEFAIETDHAPLQWLQRMKMSNQRLLRWSLTLQELKFRISYVPGKLNIVADALSRTFIFSFLIRGGKPTPFVTFAMAFLFCVVNGYLQGGYLLFHAPRDDHKCVTSPQFITGLVMFFTGMVINIHSDHVLRNLRKSGETGYKIPRGGMFNYISGANFFGEILEWWGFFVLCPSLPSLAFAVFTTCNIGPRAVQHHRWYIQKFDDYPQNRKAVIPFIL